MRQFPAIQGAFLALFAAVLFGASTPFIQVLGKDVSPWMVAGLLYAGAALTGLFSLSHVSREAALARIHLPRLLLMALFGALLGPTLLAWGLQHTNGASASLMLTLEAVFTVVLAALLYHERVDRRVVSAIALMTCGGAILVVDHLGGDQTQIWGLVAVLAATLAWAIDNTLSRALADVDPSQVVVAKATLGASASFIIAAISGHMNMSAGVALGLLLIGASGYGLSLRLYLLAQRSFGAARTGSVFAAAPFIGAAIAFALGERSFSLWMGLAAVLMMVGVILHLLEQHEHEHLHLDMDHEHAHSHDDGHHNHTHDPMPVGPHSHAHHHEPMTHRHPHVPDQHHVHHH
ncbi:EamA family transporter [Aquirhabdus sp.]|uniref:DMT family transporter n=1 Tax=Aquirhabdus sp. TaxID=2824160 RepID=UPI00396CC58E